MHKGIKRYLVLLAVITLGLTGCLRSAGDNLEAPEARALSTSTPQPSPFPTQAVPSPETIIITATIDPVQDLTAQAVAMAAQQVQDLQNQLQPTATESFPGFDVTPEGDTAFEVQQQPEVNDPLLLTATGIVAEATQRVLDLTATAEGPVIELPTFTPTDDPLLIPPTADPGAGPRMGVNCIHQVRQGENLYRLSVLYGVLVMDIARASGVSNVELIYPGQNLTIPSCGTTGTFPPATPTPTPAIPPPVVGGIDARPATGTGGAFPTATPFVSTGGVQHTVSQGETLYQISMRYGIPMDAIAATNGIANPDRINFNQVLTIP